MSIEQIEGTRSAELLELAERYAARNYHPLPVVIAEAEGAWVTDVEGAPLPGHAVGVLGAELRPPSPAADRRGPSAARSTDAHQPRVPQRPLRPVFCRGSGRAGRQGHGPDDEHRSRGGRDRDQDRAPVGVRREGRARRTARRSWCADGNFHGRTMTIVSFSTDPSARERLRPVHAGVRDGALRRRRRARARRSPTRRGRVPRRADPGRGRRGVPPDGYLRAARELCTERERAADRRRDPVRPRPHRARRSRASTRTSRPTSTSCWARPWAAGSCRSRAVVARPARSSACSSPASTVRRSAGTRSPARSASR